MTVPRGHRHDAKRLLRWRGCQVAAPRGLGARNPAATESFAHIRAAPGLAVTSAAAGVVDSGDRIDPHDDVARAARFGLGFGRVLALLRRCRGGCERYAPALGH